MNNKLLVTGSSGFVAASILDSASENWQIHGIQRQKTQTLPDSITVHVADLTKSVEVSRIFNQVKPDAVIHAAAIADIDYCQNHPDQARAINRDTSIHLADLCAESGARMIFCSTDTVFDGIKGNYSETDLPNPVNYYAETKVAAEEYITKNLPQAVIARVALVIGLHLYHGKPTFLSKMMQALDAGKSLPFPENEIRTPVDVLALGQALVALAGNDFAGVIHLSGNDRMTRYQMARRIAAHLGYSADLIESTDSAKLTDRATRPPDVSMLNTLAGNVLDTPMRGLDEAMTAILKQN